MTSCIQRDVSIYVLSDLAATLDPLLLLSREKRCNDVRSACPPACGRYEASEDEPACRECGTAWMAHDGSRRVGGRAHRMGRGGQLSGPGCADARRQGRA